MEVENKFKQLYLDEFNKFQFCSKHNCIESILNIVVPLTIYKYLKDKNKQKGKSTGHYKKLKIFTEGNTEYLVKRTKN